MKKPIIRVVVSRRGLVKTRALQELLRSQSRSLGIKEPAGFFEGCDVHYGSLRRGVWKRWEE